MEIHKKKVFENAFQIQILSKHTSLSVSTLSAWLGLARWLPWWRCGWGLRAEESEEVELELELEEVEEKPWKEWEEGDEEGIEWGGALDDLSHFFMAFSRFCLRHLALRFLNHTFFFCFLNGNAFYNMGYSFGLNWFLFKQKKWIKTTTVARVILLKLYKLIWSHIISQYEIL